MKAGENEGGALMSKHIAPGSVVVLSFVALSLGAGAPTASPIVARTGTLTSAATTTLESVSTSGEQANLYSYAIGISAHGRYVVFNSDATNLVPRDANYQSDVFVRDRVTGVTTRVSVSSRDDEAAQSPDPFGGSHAGGISADGRFVVFYSDAANLAAHDTNAAVDIFVHDRKARRTSRVSVGSTGRQANAGSGFPAISANGRYVAFISLASNLVAGDTNHASDVFVHDRATGQTRRMSVSSRGRQGNGWSETPALSADGRYVTFTSIASNLVAGDTNGLPDAFVRDRTRGETRRVSVSSSGRQGAGPRYSNGSNAPSVSANGRYVAFRSDMTNLVPGDTNHVFDIFVNDRVTRQTRRVSIATRGGQANAESLGSPVVSADGRYVAFASLATNLVENDRNEITDVFIRDRRTHRTFLASLGSTGGQGTDGSWPATFSADNRYLAFSSWAGNLVPSDLSPGPDAFVRDFGAADENAGA
jgi:Tol biopolymer transport system component